MKKIFLLLLIFASCSNDDYEYRPLCNFMRGKDSPNIAGKWELVHDFHAYRISNGKLATKFIEPITGVLKFCENGYGIYKPDNDELPKNIDVTWSFIGTDTIVINKNFLTDSYQLEIYKDTLEIVIDERDYQLWTDTTYNYNRLVQEDVVSIVTWELTRK